MKARFPGTTAIPALVGLTLALLCLGAVSADLAVAQDFDALSLSKPASETEQNRLFEIELLSGTKQEVGTLALGEFSSAQLTSNLVTSELFALLDRGSNSRIATIDPSNLRVLAVHPVPMTVAGLAADPFSFELYVAHGPNSSNHLGILDPRDGSVRDLGNIQFPNSAHSIDILAFSSSGELWGLEHLSSTQNMNLWRIETSTLQATRVGTTPSHVFKMTDAVFFGDELWVLRKGHNSLTQLSLTDASVLATSTMSDPKMHGLANKSCVAPSIELSAADNPGDSGGAIVLDWTDYAAPANLVRYEILRTQQSCGLAAGSAPVIASVLPGQPQTFMDNSVDDYTSYFYQVRVVVLVQGVEEVLDQLGSGGTASFPNVVINEFAPAGGVSKASTILVGEFVELFNISPDPIDLTGWLLSNGTQTEPLTGIIPGNGLFVHTVAVIDLPDAGGLFQLLPAGNTTFIIDDVAYGSEGGVPTAPSGFTISRVEGTDSTTPDEQAFGTSSPTPNQTNSVAPPNLGGSLVLNEVYYLGAAGSDYVELYNPTGGTIALQRFAISDGFGFVDTLDTSLDVRPGGWFVLDAQSLDPFLRDLSTAQLYLYKITEGGLFELVDHLGWGPGDGDPQPPSPDATNNTLVRNADGDALYLGDIGTNWIECGGDITLFYGPSSPGGPNASPQSPTLLVDQSGAGDFTNISDAIDAATAGVRILVAPGIYEERFNLKDQVSISGIGELPVDVILAGPGGHTPIQAFGVGSTTEVSRLSIRGGYAAADGPFAQTPASGGALRVVSGSPVFKNVRFEYNIANNNGGAVAIAGGSPVFEGCQFLNNFANDAGGAIWVVDGSPTFRSCLFVGNTSGTDGGVVFMEGGLLSLEQCVLDNNTTNGTGIVYATGGSTVIEYSMITNSLFGPALEALAPASIQFSCGLLYNDNSGEEEYPSLTSGNVLTSNVVEGDPLYCQPLAFNYAYPDASPVGDLASSCAKIIGIAGAPCGQTLTDTENSTPPAKTTLYAPVPNPFNPATVLHFELATPGRAELVVYDVRGRRLVEILGGAYMQAGAYQAEWRGLDTAGRALGSGIYFAQLRVNGAVVGGTQKMVLLK